MKLKFELSAPHFDIRWRIPWAATDVDAHEVVCRNVASFGRDEKSPPTLKETDAAFADIEKWIIEDHDASVVQEAEREKREAYLEKWGVKDIEELVKKCVDADYDPTKITLAGRL